MEQNPEYAIINIPNIKTNSSPLHNDQSTHIIQKRKNRGMRFFRMALFMMRRRRSEKPSMVRVDDDNDDDDDDDVSKSTWSKLVGSMRPLHLQSNQSPRSFSEPATTLPSPSENKLYGDSYVSDFVEKDEPYSPSPPSSCYASAVGLNELVQGEEDSEKQEVIIEECMEDDDGDGDEMIDAKADEFIAQFYEQIKLQRMDSIDRRYFERNKRSLGW